MTIPTLMKTVILKILDTKTPGGYPVTLTLVDEKGNTTPLDDELLPEEAIASDPGAAIPAAGGRGTRELGDPDKGGGRSPDGKRHAKWLYSLVFRDPVRQKLEERGAWEGGPKGAFKNCRLVLDIAAPPLRALRWEMMGDGSCRPAALPGCSVVRGPIELDDRTPPCDGPIKVLVVVGSIPNDKAVLAEEEVAALRKEFSSRETELTLKVLDRSAIEALAGPRQVIRPREVIKRTYREFKPHVFHFIGHGKLNEDGEPYLVLHDPNVPPDGNYRWELQDFPLDFGGFPPAFVFLNACYTVAEVERSDIWSIADTFLNVIRSRAVLGMHDAIRGDTAGRLAGALYKSFIEGKSLDLALTDARGEADILKSDDARREWDWSLPYLRLRVLPEMVIPVTFVPKSLREDIDHALCFENNNLFVNRCEEREKFLAFLRGEPEAVRNVVLVQGPLKIGKSHLILWCLRHCALFGRLLKYVDLSAPINPRARFPAALDAFGVLRKIIDGGSDSLISSPLPERSFESFHKTRRAMLGAPEGWGPPPTDLPEQQMKYLFDGFVECLDAAVAELREVRAADLEARREYLAAKTARADQRPFILVLDQITGVIGPTGFRQGGILPSLFATSITERFIKPIAVRKQKDLILVLAVDENDAPALGLDALGTIPSKVDVDLLRPEDFRVMAEEFFERRDLNPSSRRTRVLPPNWKQRVNDWAKGYIDDQHKWSPGDELVLLYHILSKPSSSTA